MSEAREQALLDEIEELRRENSTRVGAPSGTSTAVGKLLKTVFLSFGLAVGLFVVSIVLARPSAIPPARLTRPVPMALVELEPGAIVRESDIGIGPYPADEIVGDILLSSQVIIGQMVTEPIHPADVFHASKLGRIPDAPPTAD